MNQSTGFKVAAALTVAALALAVLGTVVDVRDGLDPIRPAGLVYYGIVVFGLLVAGSLYQSDR